MPQNDNLEQRLARHEVGPTQIRLAVLGAFEGRALSQYEVEEMLGRQFDRTSIYRTLQLFERQGIVHRVPHTESVARYALCSPAEACDAGHHRHQHLHFHCTKCGNIFCVEAEAVPDFPLPPVAGRVTEVEILLRGICTACEQASA